MSMHPQRLEPSLLFARPSIAFDAQDTANVWPETGTE